MDRPLSNGSAAHGGRVVVSWPQQLEGDDDDDDDDVEQPSLSSSHKQHADISSLSSLLSRASQGASAAAAADRSGKGSTVSALLPFFFLLLVASTTALTYCLTRGQHSPAAARADALDAPSSLLEFLSVLPPVAARSPPLPLPPARASLSPCPELPICPRTLVYSLSEEPVGFGSKMDQMLTAALACLREFDNRVMFFSDRSWIYFSLPALFMPAPAFLPIMPAWNDAGTDQQRAITEQMTWPASWSVRPLRIESNSSLLSALSPPSSQSVNFTRTRLVSDDLSIDPHLDPVVEAAVASPHSQAAVQYGAEADVYPSLLLQEAGCGRGAALTEFSNGFCSSAHRDDYLYYHWGDPTEAAGWATVARRPHVWSVSIYGMRSNWIRELRARRVTHDLLTDETRRLLSLSSPHLFPPGWGAGVAASLPQPLLIFMLKQRIIRQLFVVRSELRDMAQSRLTEWGLRSRSAVRRAIALQLRSSAPLNLSANVYSRVQGSGSIACHIRRQDKGREAAPQPLPKFVAAVEQIIASNAELGRSFPPLPPALSGQCGAGAAASLHVQLIILTDDPAVLPELQQLRPCWRLRSAFPVDAALVRKGDGTQKELTSERKRSSAQRLMVEFILAAESDYSIVTYSSNVGRLLALLRGWLDSHWERRVVSLDQAWFTFGQ